MILVQIWIEEHFDRLSFKYVITNSDSLNNEMFKYIIKNQHLPRWLVSQSLKNLNTN
jgi:hypothetical protein